MSINSYDNDIIGFITVRTTSARLPNKCLLPFGKSSVLNHIIQRAISFGIKPIVCTSNSVDDNAIIEIANEEGVDYFRGSLKNKLRRWRDCAIFFNISMFHSIDADDPFFDGNEIIQSMKMLKKDGLDMVFPTESSSAGGASVGYSLTTDIVSRACSNLDNNTDTEMMWYYIQKIPNLKTKVLPETRKNITKMRLTLDYLEDYWLLESVRRILGNSASRDEVDRLFISNPDLYKINWFKNKEWKDAQISKKI